MYHKSINSYLEYVFREFKKEISNMNSLCDLRNVSFESGQLPNYNNRSQALLYCLRYHFGYAFEYEYIYINNILNEYIRDDINVISVGCGNGIDLWALDHAIKRSSSKIKKINYLGIDCVDWIEYFDEYEGYNITYIQNDVRDIVKTEKTDVLFLPKSINELDKKDFEYLADIINDSTSELYIVASFRSEANNLKKDSNKFDELIRLMELKGFSIIDGELNVYYTVDGPKAIISNYGDYKYPDDAKEYLSDLYYHCEDSNKDCLNECRARYTRSPILNTDYVKYNIVKLKRNII